MTGSSAQPATIRLDPSISHPLPQQRRQLLPPLLPSLRFILPILKLRFQKRPVPLPQTLKGRPTAELEQAKPIFRQRHLQRHLLLDPLGARHDAYNLPVDLKAVEQVREIGEVEGRDILAVDVQPDQAIRADGAAEDLGQVDEIDVGETRMHEREDGVEVCGAE